MKAMRLIVGIALFVLCQAAAAPAPGASTGGTRNWPADLDYFAQAFPASQKDCYQLIPRDKFEREVAELKRAAPQLSDAEIILELTRVVASLGVAHTKVAPESGLGARAFHHYPIQMQWFGDSLRITAAEQEHQEAIGSRVTRVGSMTPAQAEAKVAPYIATENSIHLHVQSPRHMALVELMQHEKIADASGRLQLACAKTDGKELTLVLAPMSAGQRRRKLLGASDIFNIPLKFCRKQPNSYYWYEYLPDTHALYIQYNKCHDAPGNHFESFTAKLFAEADSRPVQRVIVDLRFNGGGDSGVVKRLVAGLKARPALIRPGHLYALIGGHTFSAGMWAAMGFHTGLHAILVGEPVGNKPNHYGEANSFTLPNSKLKVAYSTKHFRMVRNADPASLEPDIAVPSSFDDFLAGRDPVLDTALRHPLQ